MDRRTKIVCTLGPVSSDRDTIRQLVNAGMDVARLNLSHGTHAEHASRIENVRAAAAELDRVVPIMLDLQGPKIRTGEVPNGTVTLDSGKGLILTSEDIPCSSDRIHVSYDTLAEDVEIGGRVLIDDGLIELRVTSLSGSDVKTEIVVGGTLKSRKGVHLPLMRNTRPSLTDKDFADLDFGLGIGVEIVALSFVRSAQDVRELVDRIASMGKRASVVAKIEKPEAVRYVDEILEVADAVMVARGDLGIEMPLSQVPGTQKQIIRRCLAAGRPVITATQMLESMIDNPRPTRAEASDVANAVLDGSDAVMLSGETATGSYPVRTVEVMGRIIVEAEKDYPNLLRDRKNVGRSTIESFSELVTDSVSFTAFRLAKDVEAAAIACLTATGATARSIARHRPQMPLYAFTDDELIVRQLGLLWGTKAFAIPFQRDTDHGVSAVHSVLRERGLVKSGDRIVITAGMPLPKKGRTNMVHVSTIP